MSPSVSRASLRTIVLGAPMLALCALACAGDLDLAAAPQTLRERAIEWVRADEHARAAAAAAPSPSAVRLSAMGPHARLEQSLASAFKPRGPASEDYLLPDGTRATRVRTGLTTYCAAALPVHTIMGERMREQGFTVRQVACPSH